MPGDKSIGHRALIFAALAEGPCHVRGLSGGKDNLATAAIFRAMGVDIDAAGTEATVKGVGLRGLSMPATSLDCENSGTSMRLLAGLLSGQRFGSRLIGDASLTRRPMSRIIGPLRARGAHIAGSAGAKPDELYPPVAIAPLVDGEELLGIEYEMPVASAQVKSALLLSGLYAGGITALREPVLSRDHTERMMLALGVPLQTAGPMVVLDPEGWERRWDGFTWEVPGDLSSAAFIAAAALAVDGSAVRIERIGSNPTRTGFLDLLRAMNARAALAPKGQGAGDEPIGDLTVEGGPLGAALAAGELVVRMIDEVPAFCALAAAARGKSRVRDARELRVKESDRIATMARVLRAFGVPCKEQDDGLDVEGGGPLRAARVASDGDHRIAMAAAVLALRADGESVIEDVDCVDTSFPGFAALLRSLGADIVEEESE